MIDFVQICCFYFIPTMIFFLLLVQLLIFFNSKPRTQNSKSKTQSFNTLKLTTMQKKKVFAGILFYFLFGLLSMSFGQSEEIVDQVDKEPKFKGKPRNVSAFLQTFMDYPDEARLDLLEGTVDISAIVTDEGKLMEPEIEKGVDPLLDTEALRLVRLMQEWKPARKDGKEVNSRVSIPVEFRLSEQERPFIQTLKENGLDEKMPLFVIDDKIAKEYIVVPQYNVKSVRVIKGEKAVERYGPEAKNGVVVITTKSGTPPVR